MTGVRVDGLAALGLVIAIGLLGLTVAVDSVGRAVDRAAESCSP